MKSIFSVFQRGLQKTATSLTRSIAGIFTGHEAWTDETYEKLSRSLIAADFGAATSNRIVSDIRERYQLGAIKTTADIYDVTRADIVEILKKNNRPINLRPDGLTVIMLVGVNGSGKTTTAGKLAHLWKNDGAKVMLAACDTFRAAAVEQLKLWGKRTGCHVVSSTAGADPAAVAFDAVQSGISKSFNYLLIDTAGRQHTKKGLMEELAKMRRVIAKLMPDAPHETWLTIDASTGANALNQAREFTQSAGVTGLVLTKIDGTGKGGMLVAIHHELALPVFFAGFGEQPDDLQPFDPEMFSKAIFEEN